MYRADEAFLHFEHATEDVERAVVEGHDNHDGALCAGDLKTGSATLRGFGLTARS